MTYTVTPHGCAIRHPAPLRTVVANRPLGGMQWAQKLSCGCELIRNMPGRVGEARECPNEGCPMLQRWVRA